MPLPIDLILVRHGESESNYANRLDRNGEGDRVDTDHWKRHTSEYPLTKTGIEQAKAAGTWLKRHGYNFDFALCSDYVRAKETAAHLGLPIGWAIDPYLVERDTGELEKLRENDRIAKYGEDYRDKIVNHFYERPPNGESRLDIGIRWDRIMLSLTQRHENDRVLVVTHGTMLETGMIRRLHWTIEEFYTWKKKDDPETSVHNCQIIHFTRRNPETGQIIDRVRWWKTICPWDESRTKNEWRSINARRFSNSELLEQVKSYKRLFRK